MKDNEHSPRGRAKAHLAKLLKIGIAAGTAMQLSYCFPDPMPDDDDYTEPSDDDDSGGDDDDSGTA